VLIISTVSVSRRGLVADALPEYQLWGKILFVIVIVPSVINYIQVRGISLDYIPDISRLRLMIPCPEAAHCTKTPSPTSHGTHQVGIYSIHGHSTDHFLNIRLIRILSHPSKCLKVYLVVCLEYLVCIPSEGTSAPRRLWAIPIGVWWNLFLLNLSLKVWLFNIVEIIASSSRLKRGAACSGIGRYL
jgi:hypothetical protein